MNRMSAAAKALEGGGASPAISTGLISTSGPEERAGGFVLLPNSTGALSGYEAANSSPARGYVWFPSLDSRRELTAISDREIRKRIKWLWVNFPLMRRLILGAAKLIGILTPQPVTRDDDWNEFVFDHFVAHAGSPDYFDRKGRVDFFTAQLLVNLHRYRDGRILGAHTETETGGASMMFYEADQIADPRENKGRFEQGVASDKFDKHIAYSVRDGKDPSKFSTIPAAAATYYGNFESFNSIHGVSVLMSMVCDMLDIVELRGLRKHAAKNAADVGLVIEKETPVAQIATTAPAGANGPILTRMQEVRNSSGVTEKQSIHYEILTEQGVVPNLNPGEKLRVITDDRPTQNNLAFEQSLIETDILGLDLPPAALYFVSGKGMPGPAIRFNMAEVDRWTENKHKLGARETHGYFTRYVARQIKRYRESGGRVGIPPHPAGESWWNKVLYIGQPSMTIDKGREASATVTYLNAGLTTYSAEYAKNGAYGRRSLREKIRETAWMKREVGIVAEEFDVELTLGECIPNLAGVGLEDPSIEPRDDEDPPEVIENQPRE